MVDQMPGPSGTPPKVSYKELMSNPSMLVLLFARILDPIATTSIYSYMFAQLKWLSPEASDVDIAFQAGLLVASKSAAKCCTGLLWGRLADKPFGGRKLVLLISLFTSCIATIGYGLSRSFAWAIFWQVFGGATTSAIGIIRCMVAEIETRPSHRSRALLLLPLMGSVGQLLGPLLGGFLILVQGPKFLQQYPYFLPNAVLAAMFALSFVGSFLFVDETLETFDAERGTGLVQCARRLKYFAQGRASDTQTYSAVPVDESGGTPLLERNSAESDHRDPNVSLKARPLSFREIWTPQTVCTLTAHFIIAGHISTFATTYSIFLASPVGGDETDELSKNSFFKFTGGIGLSPPEIGAMMSAFGLFGVLIQTLLPRFNDRFGSVTVWRTSLAFFPIAYFLAPYSALIASEFGTVPAWVMLSTGMVLFVIGRTGAQPQMTLLINACVPAPDARGTINVAGTVVGNLSRSTIPVVLMWLYGWGYSHGMVVLGFWAMSGLAIGAMAASRWVKSEKRQHSVQTSANRSDAESQN